ncbi:MAG: RNA polymerase sigma factor [Oscillospiraceae bacterium]
MLFLLTFSSVEERDRFEYLYHKYKNLCLKKAYDILGDYSLAEDAVSEAYLRIYKNLDKIEDPNSGRTVAFLVTITRNAALTMLSKEKKNLEELDEGQQDPFELEQFALSQEFVRDVYRLLDEMEEELRHVFLLKFAYDMSNKEIAQMLSISQNLVAVRLHRAKKKLADLLVKEGFVGA